VNQYGFTNYERLGFEQNRPSPSKQHFLEVNPVSGIAVQKPSKLPPLRPSGASTDGLTESKFDIQEQVFSIFGQKPPPSEDNLADQILKIPVKPLDLPSLDALRKNHPIAGKPDSARSKNSLKASLSSSRLGKGKSRHRSPRHSLDHSESVEGIANITREQDRLIKKVLTNYKKHENPDEHINIEKLE